MVASIDIFRNNITDVNMAGVNPVVQAEDLVVIRRHDPDKAQEGLLLFLVQLDATQVANIGAGTLTASIVSREGGRSTPTSTIVLNPNNHTTETSVGRLLNSQTQGEFAREGNANKFAGAVNDPWPTGLSLDTMVNTAIVASIRLNSISPTWEHWGGLFGQDFSDIFPVSFQWTP